MGALQSKWTQIPLHLLLASVISLMVLGSFLRVGWDSYDRAGFRDMVYSQSHRPFVYRVLTPMLIRRVTAIIPGTARKGLKAWAQHERSQKLLEKWEIDPADIVEAAAACGILFVSLLLFCYSIVFLLKSVFIVSDTCVLVASLVSLLGLPPFFRYYSYLYDFPTLALFTLGLALLARRSWLAYLLVFILCCLSKETSVLLVVVFLLYFWDRMRAPGLWGLAIVQVLIFAAIKVALTFLFFDQPGSVVETHLIHNVLLEPYTFGQFGAFVLIAVGVAHNWQGKPLFLRRALWILPILLVLTFFLGLVDEYRDYFEAYPVVFALVLPSVAGFLNVRMTPLDR